MRFSLRIFLGFFFLVSIAAAYGVWLIREELKPGVRQASEDVVVDTSHLFAEFLSPQMSTDVIPNQAAFLSLFQAYQNRQPNAQIWSVPKNKVELRMYVTNAKGIVVLDSTGQFIGQDFSQWRDVKLTLEGKYGVRTSLRDPKNSLSSEMYVAAPIYHSQHTKQIVGVVTVIKPNGGMEPYIQHAKNKLAWAGVYLIVACLFLGALFSWALSHAISKLTHYAEQVSRGKQQAAPKFWANRELNSLAQALDKMRTELDGQVYIEQTLHSFTHELKSPLTGIRGAAEVLVEPLEPDQVRHFSNLILAEVERLQLIVDRLLELARLENRQDLQLEKMAVVDLISPLLQALSLQMTGRHLVVDVAENLQIRCEPFLLGQALRNLLQNAIDFTPPGQKIVIQVQADSSHKKVIFNIHNFGTAIPEYAKDRLFERFYSLPSPHRKGKGSGLGLVLSQTIAQLHDGHLSIHNHVDGGVLATLEIPL